MPLSSQQKLGLMPRRPITPFYKSKLNLLNNIAPSLHYDYILQRYYNSTNGETAFPFISIRTSNAMMWDSQGRLVWAPANLFLNSASLSSQSVTVNNGVSYTVSFYGTGSITLSVGATGVLTGTGANDRVSLSFTTTSSSVTFTVAGSVTKAQLELTGPDSPKAYNVTTGSAYYGPRFDYNPQTLTLRGLLVEPQTTNVFTKSETNLGSDWNNGSFCTATYVGDIWNRPINRITVNATGAPQFNYISTSTFLPTASTVYTSSVFLKRGNIARIQYTASANFTDAYCNYNFDTNAITLGGTNVVAGSGYAQILNNGWVRLQFSYTTIAVPVSGAGGILAFIDTDGAARLGGTATNGAYVDCFGFQIDIGGIASSYIPTFGTALARNTDSTVVTPVPFINQALGTFYVSAIPNKRDANSRRYFSLDNNSSNNRIQTARGPTGAQTSVSSVGGASDFGPTTGNVGTDFSIDKVAVRYSAAGKAVVLNGGTVATNATSPPTSGYTHLWIGHIQNYTNGNASHGWIREIRYYADVSSSSAQLQALTT